MRRIMIIGAPGSGKSTLARALGDRLDLPVYHIDREVHWLPGWEERAAADKPPIIRRIIAQDAWIFEGGNSTTYAERLARAEMLVWLDAPIWYRLWRVVRRTLRDRGQVRPDLADDCREQVAMLPEFIGFILRTRRGSRARMQALFDAATIPKHRLVWRGDVDRFLTGL